MTPPPESGGKPPGWRRLGRVAPQDPREETDEELAFHFDMRMKDYMAMGMSEDEAREAAKARLGDVNRVRDEVEHVAHRTARAERRHHRITDLRQDLKYALRMLRRTPTFTAMSVTTLALGIGATTAIFSIVYAVLLAPLPYAEPDRLVRIWETSPQGETRNVVSSGNVTDWQEQASSFTVIGAHQFLSPATLTGEGEPVRVNLAQMQPEVFRALGVPPALGRTLDEGDAEAGGTAVVSHAFWEERYGGDGDILDRRLTLDDRSYTVVGVMPRGFDFPDGDVDLWTPRTDATFDPAERTSHNYRVVARLAPGATIASAQSELDAIVARITGEHPAEMTGWGARVVPLHDDITTDVASLYWVLLGGVVVVLLIACANLANLLLARAVARQREMAVRGALGAGRGRILGQLLTESGLLALMGAAGATIVAPLLLQVLLDAAPPGTPLLDHAVIDLRMLAFTGAAALGSALLFGLAPSVRLSRTGFGAALRSGRDASSSGSTALRSALMVAQVGLTVILLVGAGLFIRSFRALGATDLGFAPEGLVVMDVDLPSSRYPDTPGQIVFYDQLLERAKAVPGVTSVASTSQPPGNTGAMTFSFAIDGRVANTPNGREDDEPLQAVTPGYFEVLGRRFVQGRSFDVGDNADGAPVVIINESLARKHWPDGNAVGERIAFRAGETPWREIVGVVADARLRSPDTPAGPAIYIPFAQKTWEWLGWQSVVARIDSGADAGSVGNGLRAALLEMDPALPPQALGTVEAAFQRNTAGRSFAMTLVGGFGILALLLSVVGLYGLISYSVAQQRREIGVRIALGAASTSVVGRVLSRSLVLALGGALGGLLTAAALSRVIEGLLYGVSPVDLATYAGTAALVLAVALTTASLPAARAARTDPIQALRSD